ncbi:MAG: hypothetical protein R6V72_16710 [Cyclobacterium sp.]|uniref:hypothetical protein n=1 Tax=Cyclobacterium TaxID=68288 RepID=UPI0012B8ED10|nr:MULTISPECIES: hypothetical protein [Cyclobacterium]
MKLLYYLTLFFLGFSSAYSQSIKIKLVDDTTNEALPNRKISFFPSKEFLITNSEGIVGFNPDSIVTDEILISGFAIDDTLISIDKISNLGEIKIKVNDILLETFEVKTKRLETLLVGDSSYLVKEEKRARKLGSFSDSGEMYLNDMRYGSFVKTPKREEIFISKLFFHVGSSFIKDSILIDIRILGNKEMLRIKPMKVYTLDKFMDLAPKAMLFEVNQIGWNEVVFEPPISIPDYLDSIFILLDQWEESNSFTISKQNFSKSGIKSIFFSHPNRVWVADLPDNSFAAFMVEFLVD